LGHNVELIDEPVAKTLGSAKSAIAVAQLLARNGVVVVVTAPKMRAPAGSLAITIDPNDTPDFAAEKILDRLAETGIVTLEAGDYSPEDEERIRQRLSQLGYIE
jgi:hypothetical protein